YLSRCERGIRPSAGLVSQIAAILAIAPADRPAFRHWARGGALPGPPPPPAAPPPRARTNLPLAADPLIGRQGALAAVRALLAHHRLVTLLGPGGVGKTRLALELAAGYRDPLADGVWFVDLAALRDPDLVVPTIAATLGLQESAGPAPFTILQRYLQDRQLLLVLDNFEQVGAAAPAVGALLAGAAGLRVLATSRAPLRVQGEQEYLLAPLGLPAAAPDGGPSRPEEAEAVQFFCARAQALEPAFTLTPALVPTITRICVALDGLPLALELAAALLRVLPPDALLAQLDRRLSVLTQGRRDAPPRHQTLRQTLAWSYALLTPAAQRLFRRLAVFHGGWTLDAAATVAGATLADLAALADGSLIRCEAASEGVSRFSMLGTIQEYAAELLAADRAAARVQAAHRQYYLALSEARGAAPRRDPVLAAEQGNLRAALQGAHAAGASLLLARLVAALWPFWEYHSHWNEGRRWVATALAAPALPDVLRARLLHGAGVLARAQADLPEAAARLQAARAAYQAIGDGVGEGAVLDELAGVALARGDVAQAHAWAMAGLTQAGATGDADGRARALHHLGWIALEAGDATQAMVLYGEGLGLARTLADPRVLARALNNLGEVLRFQGQYAAAAEYYREYLALNRAEGFQMGIGAGLHNLGYVALHQGALAEAEERFAAAAAVFGQIGDQQGLADCLAGLASTAAQAGRWAVAAQLGAATRAQLAALGSQLQPPDRAEFERYQALAQAALTPAAWATAEARGRALTVAAALEVAQQAGLGADLPRS
ncbi:MAG TPA: AAA family ATPase, partial [Chloroflexia bacterium]|nr:AAA family ATPase [Chloroflexia bacterium]